MLPAKCEKFGGEPDTGPPEPPCRYVDDDDNDDDDVFGLDRSRPRPFGEPIIGMAFDVAVGDDEMLLK